MPYCEKEGADLNLHHQLKGTGYECAKRVRVEGRHAARVAHL